MKVNKILAAIDESDFTEKLLTIAKAYAQTMNAQLGLISVVDPAPLMMSADNVIYPPDMMSDLAKSTEEMLARTKEFLGPEINVVTFAPQGNPREEIIETAKDWDADLIIIGTHGRTGLMHMVMGSVAENVIRHSSIPVLVVPGKDK